MYLMSKRLDRSVEKLLVSVGGVNVLDGVGHRFIEHDVLDGVVHGHVDVVVGSIVDPL